MDPTRISQLSKRQRECLRLVRDLGGSKEIAIQLGITKNTVDSYLREAVAILGAGNRRQAALAFAQYEAGQTHADTPHRIAGDSTWVDADAQSPPSFPPVVNAAMDAQIGLAGTSPSADWLPPLPFRGKGGLYNDLTTAQRLIWILFGAVLAALLLAATVNIADALIRFAKSASS